MLPLSRLASPVGTRLKMSYTLRFTFAMALSFIIAAVCLGAQGEHPELERLRGDLTRLEMDVHVLEDQEAKMVNKLRKSISRSRGTGIILFLFGAFCALWAQNTGRNAWLWPAFQKLARYS